MVAAVHWFRKGLRLHDNQQLLDAAQGADRVYPLFIIDPHFANPQLVGKNRYAFLLESLNNLDQQLREVGSRLFVAKGKPEEALMEFIERYGANRLTFETDSEPYAKERDAKVCKLAKAANVEVLESSGHTLHDLERYIGLARGAGAPSSYNGFLKLFASAGKPNACCVTADASHLKLPDDYEETEEETELYKIPKLEEMGYEALAKPLRFPGGEREALRRLRAAIAKPAWCASFEKPKTEPNSLEPSTTVLSPYLKFGCLSCRLFYHELAAVYASKKSHTQPPVSLHGQLLWREFFYLNGYAVENFDTMEGNPICRQIPWNNDPILLAAWKEGRTGYPFIDAIMRQLNDEGWIHHLARHAVACFLTRGDLWQSWIAGAKIFDELLLDSDWSINNANWMWLSCSSFFYQYFRVYSPIAFGKKTDPTGAYIRKYLPQLRKFPDKYIYEPWKAPKAVQQKAGCIIGTDYPEPIVDHAEASKVNMEKMKMAYAENKDNNEGGSSKAAAAAGKGNNSTTSGKRKR